MAKDDYIELIHKHVSGDISPEEREKLEKYLQQNDEARKLHRQLLETSRLLDSVPDVEPSPNIKKRIMNSVDMKRYAPRRAPQPRRGLLERIWSPRLKLAYVFAVGLVIGFIIYSQSARYVKQQQPIDTRDLYGTIGIMDRDSLVPARLEEVEVDAAHITGRAGLYQSDRILILISDLSAVTDVQFRIEFDASQLTFGGMRPKENTRIWIEHGRGVLMASASEKTQYLFSINPGLDVEPVLVMKLLQSGDVIFDHRFEGKTAE